MKMETQRDLQVAQPHVCTEAKRFSESFLLWHLEQRAHEEHQDMTLWWQVAVLTPEKPQPRTIISLPRWMLIV